jgi:hypothetical protein
MLKPENDILLSRGKINFCVESAITMHRESERLGRKNAHGLKDISADSELLGLFGEAAGKEHQGFALKFSLNTFKTKPDEEPDIEFRTSAEHHLGAVFRRSDFLCSKYVLCSYNGDSRFNIAGWLYGYEIARNELWLQGYGGREKSWFAPIGHLRPLERIYNGKESILKQQLVITDDVWHELQDVEALIYRIFGTRMARTYVNRGLIDARTK